MTPCRLGAPPGDITNASHRQMLIGRLESHSRPDVLVNDAGICDDRPLEQQSLDDLRLVIELKLRVNALAPGYFRARRNRGRAMLS